MKAKAYRDYLLEKYCDNGKSYGRVRHPITIKELMILVYSFLVERGLWYAFVAEVRNFRNEPLTGEEVLYRMVSKAQRPTDTLCSISCTFDWSKAIYGKDEDNGYSYSRLWNDLYVEWSNFLGKISYLPINHLEF
jgi:hypothetical protein